MDHYPLISACPVVYRCLTDLSGIRYVYLRWMAAEMALFHWRRLPGAILHSL